MIFKHCVLAEFSNSDFFLYILGVVWNRWDILYRTEWKWVLVICLLVNMHYFSFIFRNEHLQNAACIRSKVSTIVESGKCQIKSILKQLKYLRNFHT